MPANVLPKCSIWTVATWGGVVVGNIALTTAELAEMTPLAGSEL